MMLPDNMSDLKKASIKLLLSKTFIHHCLKNGNDISNRILPESEIRYQLGLSKRNFVSKESPSNSGYCTGTVSSSRDPGLISDNENLEPSETGQNWIVSLPQSTCSKSDDTINANFNIDPQYIKLSGKEKQDYILTLIIITSMKTLTIDDTVLETLNSIQCGLAKLLKMNDVKSKIYSKENLSKLIEETFSTCTKFSNVLNATFKILLQKEHIAAAMHLLCSLKLDMKHSTESSLKDTPRIKGIKILQYVTNRIFS